MSHPIIALWADPTLDARLLREEFKDNCTVFREPFSPLSYLYESEAYYTLKKREILAASELGPVCIFDVTDVISEDLLKDETFLQRITHTFLVRDTETDVICLKVTSCADLAPIVVDHEMLAKSPSQAVEQYSRTLGQKLLVKAMTTVPDHFLQRTVPVHVSDLLGFKGGVVGNAPGAEQETTI
mmetsp:Transcript_41563/g.97673  ORF Transcript_41563/g.97673 Transcript_41563/m.97673 type:complete len:184 (-) Transcript_41563:235-786(-)